MTTTPSNLSHLHKEDRYHDIHPSVSPHTSEANLHRQVHPSGHATHELTHHTNHATDRATHSEEHRDAHPTFAEKVQGYKEELQGKLTHNPELVQHGKDLVSGATHNESGHVSHDQAPVPGIAEAGHHVPTGNSTGAELSKPL